MFFLVFPFPFSFSVCALICHSAVWGDSILYGSPSACALHTQCVPASVVVSISPFWYARAQAHFCSVLLICTRRERAKEEERERQKEGDKVICMSSVDIWESECSLARWLAGSPTPSHHTQCTLLVVIIDCTLDRKAAAAAPAPAAWLCAQTQITGK